jgi:hypothetical protein
MTIYKMSSRAFTGTRFNMNSNSVTNQFQGGGDKKAGFPYQVGRDSWVSIAFNSCDPLSSQPHCTLAKWSITKKPLANISRPIGSTISPNPYWRIN